MDLPHVMTLTEHIVQEGDMKLPGLFVAIVIGLITKRPNAKFTLRRQKTRKNQQEQTIQRSTQHYL